MQATISEFPQSLLRRNIAWRLYGNREILRNQKKIVQNNKEKNLFVCLFVIFKHIKCTTWVEASHMSHELFLSAVCLLDRLMVYEKDEQQQSKFTQNLLNISGSLQSNNQLQQPIR